MINRKAYLYIRISDEDQSHFSIAGQVHYNTSFCERNNIEIVETFIDDGYSAKNFDRPSWKRMETKLYKNRAQVDCLVVMKYDRLIRNTIDGLQLIHKLENRWNVKVLSAMEPYALIEDDAMSFKIRAGILVDGEFERLRISDRTKFGVWQAKNEGRFIGRAPYGYLNRRDEAGKPIIVIDPIAAPVVKKVYDKYLGGAEFKELQTYAKQKGWKGRGHDAIKRMLSNLTYAGIIEVPAYRKYPTKLKDGMHLPIVSKDTFYQVQDKLSGRQRRNRKLVRPELPLRGIARCPECLEIMTGSKTTGNGGTYWYYRCPKCPKQTFNAKKADDLMLDIISQGSLNKRDAEMLMIGLRHNLSVSIKDYASGVKEAKRELQKIHEQESKLEDKYIQDMIDSHTYKKWKMKYSRLKTEANIKINSFDTMEHKLIGKVEKHQSSFMNLEWYYQAANIDQKHELIGLFFDNFLVMGKQSYATTSALEPFFSKNKIIKGLRIDKNLNMRRDLLESAICTRNGNEMQPSTPLVFNGLVNVFERIAS